jgi:hypothetical protein
MSDAAVVPSFARSILSSSPKSAATRVAADRVCLPTAGVLSIL